MTFCERTKRSKRQLTGSKFKSSGDQSAIVLVPHGRTQVKGYMWLINQIWICVRGVKTVGCSCEECWRFLWRRSWFGKPALLCALGHIHMRRAEVSSVTQNLCFGGLNRPPPLSFHVCMFHVLLFLLYFWDIVTGIYCIVFTGFVWTHTFLPFWRFWRMIPCLLKRF